MRKKYLIAVAAMTALAGSAYAGLAVQQPVTIDLDGMFAFGDQLTARTSANDVELIGCGIRVIQIDPGNTFEFGFCQATDAAEVSITCITEDPALLTALRSSNSYSFITFAWNDLEECTRIGFSTQSFYLPVPDVDDDSDSDSDSDD